MATAAAYAKWLQENQGKEGDPLYDEVLQGYAMARKKELAARAGTNQEQEKAPETLGEALYQEKPIEGDLYNQPEFALNRRGVRKGVRDPFEAAAQMVHRDPEFLEGLRQDEIAYQQARKEAGKSGFDPNRLVGNALLMAGPGGLATKALNPKTYIGKVGTGAAVAAPYGALNPTYVQDEDFGKAKVQQIADAMMYGAVVPAIGQPVGAVVSRLKDYGRHIRLPWTAGGQKKLGAEFTEGVMDDPARVMNAAANAKQGETVGQAVARQQTKGDEFGRELVKLEDELTKAKTGAPLRNARAKQEIERENLLDAIQEGRSVGYLQGKRRATTAKEYRESFKEKPKITKSTKEMVEAKPTGLVDASGKPIMGKPSTKTMTRLDKELKDIFKDPYVKTAMTSANKLAKSKGITLKSNPVQYLHYVKNGLDKQLRLKSASSGKDALTNQEKNAVKEVKSKLVDYMEKQSNKYGKARADYEKLSTPVDQAKLRDELKVALTKYTGKERPSENFARVWNEAEKTLKRAKVQVKKEFQHVLDPVDEKGVKRVYTELVDKEKYKTLTELDSVLNELPSEVFVKLPNALFRPVMIANHWLANLATHSKPKVQRHIVDMLKNPDEFVKTMVSRTVDKESRETARRLFQEVLVLSLRDEEAQGAAHGMAGETAKHSMDYVNDMADALLRSNQ